MTPPLLGIFPKFYRFLVLKASQTDLDPSEIMRAQARHIDGDMERIRKLKNELRSRIRTLVSPLDEDDSDRLRWERARG